MVTLTEDAGSEKQQLDAIPAAKVLIVDDRPENLLALEALLEGQDCRTVRAESGAEALKQVLASDFALILMDVQMPIMNGFETAKLIRERARSARVPIIFLTAISQEEQHALQGYGVGAVDYLSKPVNPDILRAKVSVFLELYRLREENRITAERLREEEARLSAMRLMEAQRELETQALDIARRQAYEDIIASHNEELQAANEELTAQSEELAAQSEELRQLNDALISADAYKDEFLSVISHELRTPLNFITGFASLLEDEVQGPMTPKQLEAVGKILNGADRMLCLVDDLLDFAKLQSGRFELVPQPTPYQPLLESTLDLIRPLANQKGQTLALEIDFSDVPVIDGARISQVLINLLSNAIKFTDSGGTIRLCARLDGTLLRTEVVDTGCGIAHNDRDKLFQRFTQLDMSNTRRAGGTGLGLAICKALIEAHGGHIDVSSEPGAGATFWFSLPLMPIVPAFHD